MNSLLHTVNPVILQLKVVILLWMVQFQMFKNLVLIQVLFPVRFPVLFPVLFPVPFPVIFLVLLPMLLQIEILKIVCVLFFELLEQRAVMADIELQQMADGMIRSACCQACCGVGCVGFGNTG